jgi:hypothetical protein
MKALRLPAAHTRSLMDSVPGPMRASNVRARRSAPAGRGGRSAGLGRWVSRHTHSGVLRSWTRAGDHRFPGDPSYAFALLRDPGRAGRTSPLVVLPMPPPASKHRRPQRKIISRLTQGFSIRCLRFKSSVAAAPARLASGWRAAPYREGVEPSGPLRKVSGHITFPLSRTSPVAIRFYPLDLVSPAFIRPATAAPFPRECHLGR